MARQLGLDLPARVSLGLADYFVSDANASAYALVTGAAPWPERKLALVGPAGSGKSHLARVWQQVCGATVLRAQTLDPASGLPAPGACIAIEDMEHLPRVAEEYLFHLHNHLAATGGALLLTSDRAPTRWTIGLRDLASRMQAATVVQVADPDDRLLAAVLAKQFADRQLAPPPDVLAYLVTRIERSFAAAAEVVAGLDALSLAERRPITRALARGVLDNRDAAGR